MELFGRFFLLNEIWGPPVKMELLECWFSMSSEIFCVLMTYSSWSHLVWSNISTVWQGIIPFSRASEYPLTIQKSINNKLHIDRFCSASDIYSNPKPLKSDILMLSRSSGIFFNWDYVSVGWWGCFMWETLKSLLMNIVVQNFFYFNQFCKSTGFMHCHLSVHRAWRATTSASWLHLALLPWPETIWVRYNLHASP